MSESKFLSAHQLQAINKIGDLLVPGEGQLPKFSETGCVRSIDRMLECMPEQDLKDLGTLLSVLGAVPRFFLAGLLRFVEWSPRIPGPLGDVLRLVRLGLRGVVMTLYYSDAWVLKVLDYRVDVYRDDLK